MRHFKKYLSIYKKQIILSPIFKFFETITDIINPIIVASMIDVGIAINNTTYILGLGAVVLAINILGYISAVYSQKLSAKASVGFATDLRLAIFKKINTFDHKDLDKYSTATLNNRLTHDVSRVQQALGIILRNILRAPILLIGSIIMSMIIDVQLSLVFLGLTPLVVGAVLLIMKITVPMYDKSQKCLDEVSGKTRENLQGARVIRAFNHQNKEQENFTVSTKKLQKASINVSLVSSLLNPITSTLVNFAIIIILWFGGVKVNVGSLSSGQVIAFINYLTQIAASLVTIANIFIALIKAVNCSKRINEILDTNPEIASNETSQLSINGTGDLEQVKSKYKVEFKNVVFTYGKMSKPAVNNLSIKIKAGETIGIIGGTGSGKSSVTYLLPRFYDATSGQILIDGKDIKDYDLINLRAKFGIIPQKAVLFTGSLRKNMQWRKNDATDEEINRAIEIAQASEFVSELKEGLNHRVQAGGKNFSGGQRQRLTIARALVGNPEILIMDDSASALDFATDANLRKAIKSLKDMTVFIVSQRVNSIKNADQIIVLDAGEIVGMGTHQKLLENCKVYKEIYDSQNK